MFTDSGDAVATGGAATPWIVTASGAEMDATALLASAKTALAEALAADLRNTVAGQDFSATTGLPLRQQWSLTKHRWLLDNVPAARTAVRRLNVAEWIVRGLGGEEATEQSLASRTGGLRLAQRSWWTATLEWSGASENLMPPIVTAGTPLGRVSAEAGLGRLTDAVQSRAFAATPGIGDVSAKFTRAGPPSGQPARGNWGLATAVPEPGVLRCAMSARRGLMRNRG